MRIAQIWFRATKRTITLSLVFSFISAIFLLSLVVTASAGDVTGFSLGNFLKKIPGFQNEPDTDEDNSIEGVWLEVLDDLKVEVSFKKDGTFSRAITDSSGTERVKGRYYLDGNALRIEPEGFDALSFELVEMNADTLVIKGEDGALSEMKRVSGTEGLKQKPDEDRGGLAPMAQQPEEKEGQTGEEMNAQAPVIEEEKGVLERRTERSPQPDITGSMVPAEVRPGLRLTFYMMTGSLPGSVNGWVPDEEGRWVDREGRHYSQERKGHSSHGLIQATVAGMDRDAVAFSQHFYLFNGEDTTPVFNKSLDSIVTPDTGGDYWMHPMRQASVLQSNPWNHVPQPGETVAKQIEWRSDIGSRNATAIAIIGDASRTTYIFDQETGFLLYLSRLTREAPQIRDRSQTLPDSVSYATFLRFVSSRQLRLPWLGVPQPEIASRIRSVAYQGSTVLESPGSMPTPMRVMQELSVMRRGGDWIFFSGRAQGQGAVMPSEFKAVQGAGCNPPLMIPPEVLVKLQPGLQIDRDPKTGFEVSVSGNDGRYVTLQTNGPRQGFTYIYGMENGLMIRRISREIINPSTPNMIMVTDVSLAGVQQ